jgi:hypothetical protein
MFLNARWRSTFRVIHFFGLNTNFLFRRLTLARLHWLVRGTENSTSSQLPPSAF